LKNNQLSECQIVFYPELAAAALLKKEHDLYSCWTVLRSLDQIKEANSSGINHRGNGMFNLKAMLEILTYVLGITEKYAYQIIQDGAGKYWNKPGGKNGQKICSLIGVKNVVKYLNPTMPRIEPFSIPLKYVWNDPYTEIHPNSTNIKYLLVGLIAARFKDRRPVTAASIAEWTGLSIRTVKTALATCDHLHKYENWKLKSEHKAYQQISKQFDELKCFGTGARIVPVNENWGIVEQLGNTYIFPEFQRLPLKHRPKDMKSYDLINAKQFTDKIYNLDSKKILNGKMLSPYCISNQRHDFKARIWRNMHTTNIVQNSIKKRKIER